LGYTNVGVKIEILVEINSAGHRYRHSQQKEREMSKTAVEFISIISKLYTRILNIFKAKQFETRRRREHATRRALE